MTLSARSVLKATRHVCSEFESGAIVLTLADGKYYQLNGTAFQIWSQALKPVTVEEILAQVLRHYTVEESTAGEAVFRVLDEMLGVGLLEVAASQS